MKPREIVHQIETNPALPAGNGDRFAGYAVIGLPFRSGHVLALRRFPASSLGPSYTSVWHCDARGVWTFYSTVNPDLGCSRYFGGEIMHNVVAPIGIEWAGASQFNVHVGTALRWEVRLTESSSTRLMNAAAKLVPDAWWQRKFMLKAMGAAARFALGTGKMNLAGKTPNGHEFIANPQRLWLIDSSHAFLNGLDLGPAGALARQARLNEFYIPQRGLFALARAFLQTPRQMPGSLPVRRGLKVDGDKGPMMNPNKALWEKGDFTEIAAFMRQSGEAVVKSLGIKTPLRVLDLGCGDGTTAVPLALLGAEVVGIDIAKNLVDAGKKRAAEAGLNRLKFQEGDACNLQGVDDHSFDLTLSVFGTMFAPKPFDAAREMVRVTKPGGRIVMGNWIPNDPTSFVSQLLKISSTFAPPPPEGFISPMTWGVDSHIIERFGHAGVPKENIFMVRDTYHFISPDKSPASLIESFRRFYGPTMNAFEAAESNGKADELHNQLLELAKAQNKSTNGGTSIPATFLRVTVSV